MSLPLPLPLHVVYYSLRALVSRLLRHYYREIRLEGFPRQEPQGPLIVLSNHPNALMDPFLIVAHLRRPVYFLANAGLFRHPLANRFLNTFFCIPVERPKDVEGRAIDNRQSFERSRRHLQAGGALYIAPEGTSYREYRLRPLKTGAARIALDLLAGGAVTEIQFLLATIHYADAPGFRSRVCIRYQSFTLRRADLEGDITDWSHVSTLTLQLKHLMEEALPHGDEARDQALGRWTRLLAPVLRRAEWMTSLYALHQVSHSAPQLATDPKHLEALLQQKALRHLSPDWLERPASGKRFWITLPLALFWLAHHPLLYLAPERLRRALGADPVYDATVRFLGAMLLLPVSILLSGALLYITVSATPWAWIYAVLSVAPGPRAWDTLRDFLDFRHHRRLQTAMQSDPEWARQLRATLPPVP